MKTKQDYEIRKETKEKDIEQRTLKEEEIKMINEEIVRPRTLLEQKGSNRKTTTHNKTSPENSKQVK